MVKLDTVTTPFHGQFLVFYGNQAVFINIRLDIFQLTEEYCADYDCKQNRSFQFLVSNIN